MGPSARFIHEGLTSSDVLDTAFGLLLTEASDLLLEDMDKLLGVLKRRAFEFKDTVQIGRSHNVHAEPITFGLKLAVWYSEMERNRDRLLQARETIRAGKDIRCCRHVRKYRPGNRGSGLRAAWT